MPRCLFLNKPIYPVYQCTIWQIMAHPEAKSPDNSTNSCNIPYSGKVWRGESLVNLENHLRFAKLKPSKFLLTITTYWLSQIICQTFFHQMLKTSKFAKLSCYTANRCKKSIVWVNTQVYFLFVVCKIVDPPMYILGEMPSFPLHMLQFLLTEYTPLH